MKTVKFITLGCKSNQYDTQEIRETLLNAGFNELNGKLPADIYLINTCTVTQKADRESLYYIRRSFQENPKAKIVVTGCLTKLDSRKISLQPGKKLIIKDRDMILSRLNDSRRTRNLHHKGISYFKGHSRAFLKIQDGCDNFCSYCKVPLVRGKSRSKSIKQIVKEAEALVKNGFKEIVSTGICLGSYGRDFKPQLSLVDVVTALEQINGLFRIRLSSIEAADVTDELINKIAQSNKICRHLHIPIQSGDDKVLKAMNRRYTQKDYLELISKIKRSVSVIAITTDIIVGFPGETERAFNNTVKLIRKINPLKTHIFPYSLREKTLAYDLKGQINPLLVKKRMQYLENISQESALVYKKKFLGKKMDVLIEGRIKGKKGFWEGYTGNYLKVKVASNKNLKNKLISLKLNRITEDYIEAKFY